MLRASLRSFLLLLLLPALLAACGKGQPDDFGAGPDVPNTADALRDYMASLHQREHAGDARAATAAMTAMIPDEKRLRVALADGVDGAKVKAILGWYDDMRARPMPTIAHADNTEVTVHAATTAELAEYVDGSNAQLHFAEGARDLARNGLLRPGKTFYVVELTKPGEGTGVKYHMFFHEGATWWMLGQFWRALK
jgi:hypothetical protein